MGACAGAAFAAGATLLLRLRLASFGAEGGPGLPYLALGEHRRFSVPVIKFVEGLRGESLPPADASFIAGRCLIYSRVMSS